MLAVSRGLDRDRIVDETGHQTVVFGRRGARPFNLDEMQRFLRRAKGASFRVEDVKVEAGELITRSGAKLAPPQQPPASRATPAIPPRTPLFLRDLPPLPDFDTPLP
jgi:hypothetical protein